jgi:hypothetical protein
MLWVIATLGVILVAATLWRWGRRPSYYRNRTLEELGRSIDGFLVQMAPGSTLIAERQGGAGFLQLAIRSASGHWQSVEFGLPEAEWSQGNFDRLVETLGREGFPVILEPGNSGRVNRFLRVAVAGESVSLGTQLHQLFRVAHGTLGWTPGEQFTVHFEGGLRKDRGVMPVRASGGSAV